MAWSAPMTAVANAFFTAAQYNTYVRDNLLETGPGKATTAGSMWVSTGNNTIAETAPVSHTITTSQTTTATTWSNLTTVGPTVTVTTRSLVYISFGAFMNKSGATSQKSMALASVAITGASNIPASTARCIALDGTLTGAGTGQRWSSAYIQKVTPGSNTFTMKYMVYNHTGVYANRHLIVLPL